MSEEPSTPIASELQSLQVKELRLRIRDLALPWWRKPAFMAPLATIVAAIVGLIWAMTSGFFDVSRRELAVSKRELEMENLELTQKRDLQTKVYRESLARQRALIGRLQTQEADLRKHLSRLNRPIVIDGTIEFGTPRSNARNAPFDGPFTLELTGVNFGSVKGGAKMSMSLFCSNESNLGINSRNSSKAALPIRTNPDSERPIEPIAIGETTASIRSWSEDSVTFILNIRNQNENTREARIRETTRCYQSVSIILVRPDGQDSNQKIVEFAPDRPAITITVASDRREK